MMSPRDLPPWVDLRTVAWCAERCDAIAARVLYHNGGHGFIGAGICASHLHAVADCAKPWPAPLPANRALSTRVLNPVWPS